MENRRSVRLGRVGWAFPLILAMWLALPAVSSAGPAANAYGATISSERPVVAGATARFTLTLANHEGGQMLGSANLAGGGGFTILRAAHPLLGADPAAPRGRVTLRDGVVELRDLSLPSGASVTLPFTAEAGCRAGTYAWDVTAKASNDFSGAGALAPAGRLTTDVSGECELEFIRQPAAAQVGVGITDTPLQSGQPIQVRLESETGQPVTEEHYFVTLAIKHVPPGGTSHLDGTTTVETVDGVATFCDQKHFPDCELPSIAVHGHGYTLIATSHEIEPAVSVPFDIVDAGTACEAGRCDVSATVDNTRGEVAVLAGTGDLVFVTVGQDSLECTGYTSTSQVVTYSSSADSTMAVSITIDLRDSRDHKPLSSYQVCFSSSQSFVDRFGHVVPPGGSGLLADCSKHVGAPCAAARERRTCYIILKFVSPPGDPKGVG